MEMKEKDGFFSKKPIERLLRGNLKVIERLLKAGKMRFK